MKRRQRKTEAVTVPAHLADPRVEDFVEPHEVGSVEEAQALAADRHTEQWNAWYAALPRTTVEVPVVNDRAALGTAQVDDVVEVTGPLLVGITVEQTRRLLLGERLRFRDQESFRQAMRGGMP